MLQLRKTPPLVDFARLAWRRFHDERCPQIAASLTFAALLAVVPILTVALTVISLFPAFRAWMRHLQHFLVQHMIPESAASVAAYTEQFALNAARLTVLGIAILFVTAMIVLQTIDRALNQIWRVPRPRPAARRLVIYAALLTVGPLLIGASLALTSWLVSYSLGLVKDAPLAGEALLKLAPIALTGFAFAFLYVALPNRRVLVRDALSGGFLAALAFEGMKHAFALYITQFPTHRTVYGAFAGVPAFLLWVYLSWLVVLLGAVVAAVMPEWRGRGAPPQPSAGLRFLDALQVLRVLWEAGGRGEAMTASRVDAATGVAVDGLDALLESLARAGWVARRGRGWRLKADVAAVSVADVYRLYVLRADAAPRGRDDARRLDQCLLELARGVEEGMQASLEDLFIRAANAPSSGATPPRQRAGTIAG